MCRFFLVATLVGKEFYSHPAVVSVLERVTDC